MKLSASLISIVMPAYNAGCFIAESIESVLAQTYQYWELIIVDDGSTDNTKEVVSSFVNRDKRISYIFQANGKQGKARNNGIKNSKGTFIAFLDTDDLWHPQKLELQLKILINKNVDLVFSDGYIFTSEGPRDSTRFFKTITGKYNRENGLSLFLHLNRIPILSVLVSKDSLSKVNFFSEDIEIQNAEDYHLWLKLLIGGCAFYGMAEKLVYYRVHDRQTTKTDNLSIIQAIHAIQSLIQHVDLETQILMKEKLEVWYRRLLHTINFEDVDHIKSVLDTYSEVTCSFIKPRMLSYCAHYINSRLYKKVLFRILA